MKVRRPEFDFTGVDPHWSPNHEFAQMINAGAVVPTYIEPFLIKVMKRAKDLLDPVLDAELIADIEIFNKQEAQHFRLHGNFNKVVRESGYPKMAEYEAALVADYDLWLQTKSLRWLVAYCGGFESLGPLVATMWVDNKWSHYLQGADPRPADLWTWHFAEEFEHRTVVHRVWTRLYGRHRVIAYLYRVYGFFYLLTHLGKHMGALRKYLIAEDREHMSDGDLAASVATERKLDRENVRFQLAGLRILSPFYDPENAPRPANLDAVLARY